VGCNGGKLETGGEGGKRGSTRRARIAAPAREHDRAQETVSPVPCPARGEPARVPVRRYLRIESFRVSGCFSLSVLSYGRSV
jgi:hypothetical protein